MLTPVAEGVLVRQSELLQNNAVAVQGRDGVLAGDPAAADHPPPDARRHQVSGMSTSIRRRTGSS